MASRVNDLGALWVDGEIVEADALALSPLSQTLQYAWGAYEGIRCYDTADGPALFRGKDHLRRLLRSAALYGMSVVHTADDLLAATRQVVRCNGWDECYVRPLLFVDDGTMGIEPSPTPMRTLIMAWQWPNYLPASADGTLRVGVSSWRRPGPDVLPQGAKASAAYATGMLAKIEATRAGLDEALLLNPNGMVTDACTENVFIVNDGAIATPPLSDGPLAGITRDTVMTLAMDRGHVVEERSLTRADLYDAAEVFLTGTAAEVLAVGEVDGRAPRDADRPVSREIAAAYGACVRGADPAHRDWLELVTA